MLTGPVVEVDEVDDSYDEEEEVKPTKKPEEATVQETPKPPEEGRPVAL
jgi:hypothetical protein